MQLTGAQIVVECLKEQGVDTVFGYPGGTILNIYDELYKHSNEIRHILTSHEQGAAHAADGYARATGKSAYAWPQAARGQQILSPVSQQHIWILFRLLQLHVMWALRPLVKTAFRKSISKAFTMPITKHNYIVKDVNQLADTIRKSFVIAKSGRPGPVHIDITKDVTEKKAEYIYEEPKEPEIFSREIDEAALDKAVELIFHAKNRLFLSAAVSSVQMLLRNLKSLSAKSMLR